MTIRDFLAVTASDKDVFIKPAGRKCYYEGTMNDIPETLKDAEIEEISPRIYANDPEANARFCVGWGIWVARIPEYEYIMGGRPEICNWAGHDIDEVIELYRAENFPAPAEEE